MEKGGEDCGPGPPEINIVMDDVVVLLAKQKAPRPCQDL